MDKIDAETASEVEDNDAEEGPTSVVDQIVSGIEKNITNSNVNSTLVPKKPTLDFEIQEPFQPGSTPIHLQSRFMVWNSVGIVKAFSSEEEKSIDVEFHDTAIHHPIHLSNISGYTMAALSDKCLVLAREADADEDSESNDDENTNHTSSKVLCHYFGSSDVSKEWGLAMPNQEEIMAVACGDGWVSTVNLMAVSPAGLYANFGP